MSVIFRINLVAMTQQMEDFAKLLKVNKLEFKCDFDATSDASLDLINEFSFYEEGQPDLEFEHELFDAKSEYEVREPLVNMICENILYYTAACRIDDLYRVFAEGVLDFENKEIVVTSCYGSEYVSTLNEFALSERSSPAYSPSISTIYLDDDLRRLAEKIDNKVKSNIDIQTIKI